MSAEEETLYNGFDPILKINCNICVLMALTPLLLMSLLGVSNGLCYNILVIL